MVNLFDCTVSEAQKCTRHPNKEVVFGEVLALVGYDEFDKCLEQPGRLGLHARPILLEIDVRHHRDGPRAWPWEVVQLHISERGRRIGGEDVILNCDSCGCANVGVDRLEVDAVAVLQSDFREPSTDAVAGVNVCDGVRLFLQVARHTARPLLADTSRPIIGAALGTERRGTTQGPFLRAFLREVAGEARCGRGALDAVGHLDWLVDVCQVWVDGHDVSVVPGGDVTGVDAREEASIELERVAQEISLGNGVEDCDCADGNRHVKHRAIVVNQLLEAGGRHGDVARAEVRHRVVVVVRANEFLHARA
mmetsp:Transcript_22644/g.69150  ORF Transcript_22644/g.69150 Transcript_22644/m.69150 type:complete len:307 (+) Transcript_22644:1792-2712(+)|eukprot:scaffold231604_cov31-Tisochrysis_lutea.AAC.1